MKYLLECDHHAGPQPAYVVCKHVADEGAAVAFHQSASPNVIGSIGCARCREHPSEVRAEDMRVICQGCCRDHGWTRRPS